MDGQALSFLGLTVGVIVHDLDDEERREAYASDVTYGTNNEFGFDYLRDNMKFDDEGLRAARAQLCHRGRSGLDPDRRSSHSADHFRRERRVHRQIRAGQSDHSGAGKGRGDRTAPGEPKNSPATYIVDEKHRSITVTEKGWEKVEQLLGIGNIADPENWELKHHVETAVKAHALYRRDVEYVVKDGEVIIVDEFTGRLMPGRRWSDGLHQAVEAKENVKIERENQTLATITFQNYFRMYKKLAGMTGTAETEAAEFDKIYRLEVMVIPTNKTDAAN